MTTTIHAADLCAGAALPPEATGVLFRHPLGSLLWCREHATVEHVLPSHGVGVVQWSPFIGCDACGGPAARVPVSSAMAEVVVQLAELRGAADTARDEAAGVANHATTLGVELHDLAHDLVGGGAMPGTPGNRVGVLEGAVGDLRDRIAALHAEVAQLRAELARGTTTRRAAR